MFEGIPQLEKVTVGKPLIFSAMWCELPLRKCRNPLVVCSGKKHYYHLIIYFIIPTLKYRFSKCVQYSTVVTCFVLFYLNISEFTILEL